MGVARDAAICGVGHIKFASISLYNIVTDSGGQSHLTFSLYAHAKLCHGSRLK